MTPKNGTGHRQRIKDRFIEGSEGSLTDEALLELLLTYAIPQQDVRPLAQSLLETFGDLAAVLNASHESLCSVSGVKASSGVLLKLVDWIRTHYPASGDQAKGNSGETRVKQLPLFPHPSAGMPTKKAPEEIKKDIVEKVIARRGTEMFSKALLKEAIALLPDLPDTESLKEIREYLRGNLHFSAEQTRHRYANYIVRRMFPEGYADDALRKFAKNHRDARSLRDVCFYRFLRSEPLQARIVQDLLLPSLGTGRLARSRLKAYLAAQFPASGNIKDCAQAAVDAMSAAGIAKADKTTVHFAHREIPISAFAFVLHSEFPEPGMYNISDAEDNQLMKALLWNPTRILPSLYELRNKGILGKVSEIDSVRQFTTVRTLDQVVDQLTPGVATP